MELVKQAETYLLDEAGEHVKEQVLDEDGLLVVDELTGEPKLRSVVDPDGPIVLSTTESVPELTDKVLKEIRAQLDGFVIERIAHTLGEPVTVRVHRKRAKR